ncbi:MAG: hypothetical protein JXK05_03135 [Campylobacterales bacterium]|nr:hypothetical protein [Campylobacterales bacterium]
MNWIILCVCAALLAAFVHFLYTPKLSDRIVAFDTMGIISIALLVLLSLSTHSALYLDIAFVFGLIGFIGTILFAKYLVARRKDV